MSTAKELRELFSPEQLAQLDAVSKAMLANPEVLDNHKKVEEKVHGNS